MTMTPTPTITPEERAAIRALKSESIDEFGMCKVRQYSGLKAIDLLDALEGAEAELKEARVAVQECEEGWTTHSVEQEQKAPLTKHGRAAWWAHIEKSVQHGNAVGHAAMMEIPATDVQRFLELIESAEARAENAENEVRRLKGDGECPECGEPYDLPEQACCTNWLVRQAEYGVIGTEMHLDALKSERDALKAERDVLMGHICKQPCKYCPVEAQNTYDCDTKNGPASCQTFILKWAKQQAAHFQENGLARNSAGSNSNEYAACVSQVSDKEACASENGKSERQKPCPGCDGKGGLEYEPGLLTHVCHRCNGTGKQDAQGEGE